MDFFIALGGVIFLCAIVLFFLKPHKQPKSKEYKQEEIRELYRQRLHVELSRIDDPHERQTKKIMLLKTFAKELEFNLFFNQEEMHSLIKELASY